MVAVRGSTGGYIQCGASGITACDAEGGGAVEFAVPWVVAVDASEATLDITEDFGVNNDAPSIRIRVPFLVAHCANDPVVPVANAQKLFNAIPESTPKSVRIFAADESGCKDAHVDDRLRGICGAADWPEGVLTGMAKGRKA